MEIEKIIYDTTRPVLNLEDKLSIAAVFIFCYKYGSKTFAELLYTHDPEAFVNHLNEEYIHYEVDFTIKFLDKVIKECFYRTLDKVKEKYDSNGYYKALFEGDHFALVIDEITNYNFDKVSFTKAMKNVVVKQLTLF